ncbi:MAG TPA: TolC family protein [Bacteroidaceae bacterium]|jgi:outer membrane protein|nr:TolC family protein [Bacteroidaceae bacterium]MBP8602753.1 TolC family protein [Bacteroidaceae bacterium]HOD67920.1 TolC family protein [Bacteroidaceae bacterium]HQL25456.1 TolC family protein [Bacteroidaceae bacterium]
MKRGFLIKTGFLIAAAFVLGQTVCAQDAGTDNVLRVSLDDALRIALSDNPTIKIAQQQIEVKKVSNKEAWQALLPTADFGGTVQYTLLAPMISLGDFGKHKMGMDNTSTWSGQFQVSLPLFAPTIYATMNLTKSDLENAMEQSRSSKLDLVNQVTKAYYQVMLAQDGYDALFSSFEQARENFYMVSKLYELGGTSEYDKISAEVQVRSLSPTLIQARNAVAMAKLQLLVLMGVDPETEIEVEGAIKDYEDRIYAEVMELDSYYSLEDNSNMRQLKLNETMLNQTLRIQKMNFLPTLALSGNYSLNSLQNKDWNIGQYEWAKSSSVILSVSIPIFKAGNFTKLRSTKLQISQLSESIDYTERQLGLQVKNYVDNMRASAEQAASNNEAIRQAEKGREIAGKRYETGKGTILELNNSEVALTQAKLTYSQSIYNYLAAKADLDKVLGRE